MVWNKTVFPAGRVESVHVSTSFVAPSQQFNRVLQVRIDVEVELPRRPRFVGILNKAVELWVNAIPWWQQLHHGFMEQMLERSLFWERLACGLLSLSERQRGHRLHRLFDRFFNRPRGFFWTSVEILVIMSLSCRA